jgi:hypothetical protein
MSIADTPTSIAEVAAVAGNLLGAATGDVPNRGSLYISRLVACLADAGPQIILQYGNADITASELLASIYRYAEAIKHLARGGRSVR